MQAISLSSQVEQRGFAILPQVANETEVETLLAALQAAHESEGAHGNVSGVYAMRNVLQIDAVCRVFQLPPDRPFRP